MSFIECDSALLVTLIHALELLCQYGVKSFYMFLKSFLENLDGSKSASQQSKLKAEITKNSDMSTLYTRFKEAFDDKYEIVLNIKICTFKRHYSTLPCFTRIVPVPRSLRHPKLLKLEELILEHFKKFEKSNVSSTNTSFFKLLFNNFILIK